MNYVAPVIALTTSLVTLTCGAYSMGARATVKTFQAEAARHSEVCHTLEDMAINDLNDAIAKAVAHDAGVKDVRDVLAPNFECQHLDKLKEFQPK